MSLVAVETALVPMTLGRLALSRPLLFFFFSCSFVRLSSAVFPFQHLSAFLFHDFLSSLSLNSTLSLSVSFTLSPPPTLSLRLWQPVTSVILTHLLLITPMMILITPMTLGLMSCWLFYTSGYTLLYKCHHCCNVSKPQKISLKCQRKESRWNDWLFLVFVQGSTPRPTCCSPPQPQAVHLSLPSPSSSSSSVIILLLYSCPLPGKVPVRRSESRKKSRPAWKAV